MRPVHHLENTASLVFSSQLAPVARSPKLSIVEVARGTPLVDEAREVHVVAARRGAVVGDAGLDTEGEMPFKRLGAPGGAREPVTCSR